MSYNGNHDAYRKRPVNVRAWRASAMNDAPAWVLDALESGRLSHTDAVTGIFHILTNEGPFSGKAGDWVVKAEDGRIWVTDDRYFRDNYERVLAEPPMHRASVDCDDS
jgi:hypothetical protein